jgi:two-component system CheB/CheR fusion protein
MSKMANGTVAKKRKAPVDRKKPKRRGKVSGASAGTALSRVATPDTNDVQPAQPVQSTGPGFSIVGVGASAGGLQAFSQLLRALSADSNLAIVYVQHLAPKYESSLADLLGENTSMPVAQITDGMTVRPGHVYVIPPNTFLSISDGILRLSPRPEGRAQHCPVDHFFRSLAEDAQQWAVGVILSGTDSDGAAGVREIKAVGGIVFAQEASSAKFDGMPRAAVSTGAVDKVLEPDGIAHELMRLSRHPLLRHVQAKIPEAETPISEENWQRIFTLLRTASGVDFTHYKQPTLRRRLQRRMVLNKSGSVEHYLRYLQQNSSEVNALYQDILIHVTRFFREPDSYEYMTNHIFPQIVDARASGEQPVRVWVPGCSTGEEAYSVAICLLEFLGDSASATPVQVFATDVSELAVEQARTGIYPHSISEDVSPERLRRFFNKVDGSYRISKPVRDTVIFARQDLTRDPPFSKLDLIVCRNVLIYLGPQLQRKLVNVFHYALKPTGFLMLGASETIGAQSDLFALTDKQHRAYSKKMSGVRASMDFPMGKTSNAPDVSHKPPADIRTGTNILNEANRLILGKYAPPGVVVDEDLQIVQFRGQTGPYLEPAPGEASFNLLRMAREGLLFDLRAAMNEARKTRAPARRDGLRVKYNGRMLDVDLEVMPLTTSEDGRHFLVVFEDATSETGKLDHAPPARARKGQKAASVQEGRTNQRMLRLQQELAANREYLQSIIQDLEAANEELQSANEEILSSNEEMQSTNEELDTAKEELQSTNEELNTVNEELQGRNEELSRANSDLLNLLSSVQIAVVMVTSDLRIRRFTPMAEKVLNLIPGDVGRPIGDIKPNIDVPDLERLIVEAVDTVSSIERQAKDKQGVTYLVRIRPYKNVENRIDGAVLALFDLEMARQQERTGPDAKGAINDLLAVAHEPMLALDGQLRVLATNRPFEELFQTAANAAMGRLLYEIGNGQWNIPGLRELLEKVLPEKGHVANFPLEHDFGSLGHVKLQINAHRVARTGGAPDMILLSINLSQPGGAEAK